MPTYDIGARTATLHRVQGRVQRATRSLMRASRLGTIGIPAGVVAIVVMLVIPLPSFVLDLLISVNMSVAVLVLLVSMRVLDPLEFSVFPSLLLVATLFRLALNVSATRLVLLHGYAGNVIQSFGHFVVGGSLVVGLVVFLILIVIQFVVITNGAGRVAEVAARFTLDAMPGKQMAIDADLNSGLIDADEARRRRKKVADEADFYGAMDGASKFVKGDAVAAIVITGINLIGGFAVGVLQHHVSVSDAASTYSLLSVGDGLVSQIPALLMSVSAGIVVTRSASEDEFGTDLMSQLVAHSGAVRMTGVALCLIGIVPGLPKIPFLLVGVGLFIVGSQSSRRAAEVAAAGDPVEAQDPSAPDTTEALVGEMRVEPLELELAFDLIDLVDIGRGGDLLARVRGLRRKIASELGIIVPPVRTRDNLSMEEGSYSIRLHGVDVGRGRAPLGRVLAIGDNLEQLPGEATEEPVFGLAARWVPTEMRQHALMLGCTVVDRASVITTHLSEIIRSNAASLLNRQQVKDLLDVAKTRDSVAVDELGAAQLPLGQFQAVLCALLNEGVPIRDLVRIVEAVTERSAQAKDTESLIEAARQAVGPTIAAAYAKENRLPVLVLDAQLEQVLVESLRPSEEGSVLGVDPSLAEALIVEAAARANAAEQQGISPVLVCTGRLRPAMRRMLKVAVPRLPVMSVNEIGPHVRPDKIGVVSLAVSATV
ncbi:MAG TPA: flagellar biosynthesis protein FlhA [Acidimicrobiales bacterium]|nr:flagellar biosynthesis protein FlhA [Acidimicrobiales bacterium]